MKLNTRTRRSTLAVGAAAIAASTLMGGAAHADTGHAVATSRSASSSTTSFVLYNHGDSGLMPTWGWGGTTLCVTNYGLSTGVAKVQARFGGAAPEYVYVPPFGQNCINRWWFGNPLVVTDSGYTPLRITGS